MHQLAALILSALAFALCSCATVKDGWDNATERISAAAGIRFTNAELQFYIALPKLFRSDEEALEVLSHPVPMVPLADK